MSNNKSFTATIGIECHVQLKTATKLFAPVDNDAREAQPNQHISHICMGMPGALPVLNDNALRQACRAAFVLGTKPQKYSAFDRKNYFYPDLPKGYQITQQYYPIIKDGLVPIQVDGELREIRIERAHIEEDAGKSIHPQVGDYSLVDLNRAGTPLLEIVSAPVLRSAQEARIYAYELYLRMRYAGISDANLYHGNMRFDVNVSVSDTDELGTRTETKNLNSFRSVERAVAYEIQRQTELLQKGEPIVQETRGWDEAKQRTTSQRSKEEAHDYRYFPEPDIPPIELDDAYIEDLMHTIPMLPDEIRSRLIKRGISQEHVEIVIEAELDHEPITYITLLLDDSVSAQDVKALANLMVNVEIPARRDEAREDPALVPSVDRLHIYQAVLELIQSGSLSSTNAKLLLEQLLFTAKTPKDIADFAKNQGYIQVSDESAIETFVDQVIAEQSSAADDVRRGEHKAIGFLVGCVMKQSRGAANPAKVKALLIRKLTDSES